MVAEEALLAVGLRLERRQILGILAHLEQAAVDQVGMAPDQCDEPPQLRIAPQRAIVAAVEVGDLLDREVIERHQGPDVEGGLVDVGDEQVGLGRVGDRQRQPSPGATGLHRPRIVPGAEKGEDLTAEGAGEQAVHLVEGPDQGRGDPLEDLAPQERLEVGIRGAVRVPGLRRGDVDLQVVGDPRAQRLVQRLGRLELGSVQLLEIGEDDLRPASRARWMPRASSEVLPIWRAPRISTMLSRRARAEWKMSSVGRRT